MSLSVVPALFLSKYASLRSERRFHMSFSVKAVHVDLMRSQYCKSIDFTVGLFALVSTIRPKSFGKHGNVGLVHSLFGHIGCLGGYCSFQSSQTVRVPVKRR